MDSWYNNDKGFAQVAPKKQYTRRFWMPNDSDRLITFVDDPIINLNGVQVATPFKYNEYTLNLNGHWRNWFTKPLNPDDDVLGQMDYRASKVAALTVVDHHTYEDKNGVVYKDQLTLYVIKRSAPIWKQITKMIERDGSLKGKTYRVHRMGDKSPACGVMLEKHDKDFPLTNDHVPFNYLEVLKPKSKQELEALFSNDNDPFHQAQNNQQAQSQAWGNQAPQQQSQNWSQGQGQPQQSWGGQPQQSQGWNQQPPQQQSQGWSQQPAQENRTYGMTSNGGSDTVPF